MCKHCLAFGVNKALDLCDADLRINNEIAAKAAASVSIQDIEDFKVQEHLIK